MKRHLTMLEEKTKPKTVSQVPRLATESKERLAKFDAKMAAKYGKNWKDIAQGGPPRRDKINQI